MSSSNILLACRAVGMRPVCDHAQYSDGECILAGGSWHFSNPSDVKQHRIPLRLVNAAFFYTNAKDNRSKKNEELSGRWSTGSDSNQHTICTAPNRRMQSFVHKQYTLQRVSVIGQMNSANIIKACTAKKMRPVCDHSSYIDGLCIPVGEAWHFSFPGDDRKHGVCISAVQGSFFYAAKANGVHSQQNLGTESKWTSGSEKNGDTFCTMSL